MKTKLTIFLMCVVLISLGLELAFALKNPSVVYCEEMGYTYVTETTEQGEVGLCVLPDNRTVDAWGLLEGKDEVALNWSYCTKKGFKAKHVTDSDICRDCIVCVLEDGREVRLIELMELDLRETVCGDGVCGFPENFMTCSRDCLSGGADVYCDGIAEGKCDPDCETERDSDCEEECGEDTLAVKRRITPYAVTLPAYVTASLEVQPKKSDITGIVITEHIPEGITFATETSPDPPDSWDTTTREAKWVLKDETGIKPKTLAYKLEVSTEGVYEVNGNWIISSSETCPIIWDNTFKVMGTLGWPPCPISDLELLEYIDLWAAGELTDTRILQTVWVWAKKPDCGIVGDES